MNKIKEATKDFKRIKELRSWARTFVRKGYLVVP
jgi:hypothetical protein